MNGEVRRSILPFSCPFPLREVPLSRTLKTIQRFEFSASISIGLTGFRLAVLIWTITVRKPEAFLLPFSLLHFPFPDIDLRIRTSRLRSVPLSLERR